MRCDAAYFLLTFFKVNVVNSVNCTAVGLAPPVAASVATKTKAERLRELVELLQQDLITQEEYNIARASILAS
jgi:hypothetical protein